ncbi:MAG: transglutaminase domain-containing protein [Oscillospiraceae bacterium]
MFTQRQREDLHETFADRLPSFGALRGSEITAALAPLTSDTRACAEFCYTYMPVEDLISYSPALILRHVSHAVMLYGTSPFLRDVPLEIFLNFVLFYRAGNEFLTDFKEDFYRVLLPRVEHLDAKAAALEVNFWCCEMATYMESDDRTASPVTTLRRTYGRCGEESVLLVSALRSVGLPARQCYTPRWAHCDDNHAWVEVYADGRWQYLGACEPEPVLNKGWFTAAASKAILVHSKVFNRSVSGEEIANQTPIFCNVNNTASYGKTTVVSVRVTRDGVPLPGLEVRFEIVNYSELFPVATVTTDEDGTALFRSGLGDLYLHIHDEEKFMNVKLDTRIQSAITVDFGAAVTRGTPCTFELIPPAEDLSSQEPVTEQMARDHEVRFAAANEKRIRKEEGFLQTPAVTGFVPSAAYDRDAVQRWLSYAKGNADELVAFLQSPDAPAEDKTDLLTVLREKDFVDTPAALMLETIREALPYKGNYPHEVYCQSLLSPRIGNEMLLSQRPAIRAFFAAQGVSFQDPLALWDYLTAHVKTDDTYSYQTLDCDVKEALRLGFCDSHSLDMLFVACCRTLGFAARLSPSSGKKEYYRQGDYLPLGTPEAPAVPTDSALVLRNTGEKSLLYFAQVSVARLENGVFHSLVFWEQLLERELTLPAEPGYYRILTTARQIDGSVKCHVTYADVPPHGSVTAEVALPHEDIRAKLKYVPLADCSAQTLQGCPTTLFSHLTRSHAVVAFLEPGKEPTEHLLNELMTLSDRYTAADCDLVLLAESEEVTRNRTLQKALAAIPKAEVLLVCDYDYLRGLHRAMGVGDERKPFVLALDGKHRGLYAFSNYNVGTALTLLAIIESDRASSVL